jgi:hypothetical protein
MSSKHISYYDPEYEPSNPGGVKDDARDDESDGEEVAQTDYNTHLHGTNKVCKSRNALPAIEKLSQIHISFSHAVKSFPSKVNPSTVVPVGGAEVATKAPKTAQAGNLAASPKGSAIIRKDGHLSCKETVMQNKLNNKFRPVFVTKDSQGQTKKGPVQKGGKDYDMLMAELENPAMLVPYGVKRRVWDFLISCIVVYLIILLPLEVFVEVTALIIISTNADRIFRTCTRLHRCLTVVHIIARPRSHGKHPQAYTKPRKLWITFSGWTLY